MSDVVAVILMFGIIAYAVFGGADFGAGFWDLFAGGAQRGARPRAVIAHSIGPVWEANHVWLIFILVVLWTGFPEAFASITLTLYVPLALAALGIVLRGSSFAFRKEVSRTSSERNFGAAFASSSVLVPYCLGAVAGAIASGQVPAGGKAGDPWSSWINPTSILGGVLAVTVCAFLAAVYLVWDARRLDDAEMVEYFRRRAVAAAVVAGVVAFVGFFVLHDYAKYVFDGLTSRALPLVIISAICGIGALVLLVRDAHRWARVLSHGRRRHRGRGLGRRAVALHPADEPQGLPGRRADRHPHHDPRRLHPRRDHHPAVARLPLRAGPEEHARTRRTGSTVVINVT